MLRQRAGGTQRECKRVLLLRLPPFVGFKSHHPRDVTLPMTIGYIATDAAKSGRDVQVMDLWATPLTMAGLLDRIRAYEPDAIFFEADAPPYPAVLKCAEAVRGFSDARMFAFGSVPTFVPDRVVGPNLPFDVAIVGESEFTAAELLDTLDANGDLAQVQGIAYWDVKRGQIHRTPGRPLDGDLDCLPVIDYGLFDLSRYHPSLPGLPRIPASAKARSTLAMCCLPRSGPRRGAGHHAARSADGNRRLLLFSHPYGGQAINGHRDRAFAPCHRHPAGRRRCEK